MLKHQYSLSVAELLYEISRNAMDRHAAQCELLLQEIMRTPELCANDPLFLLRICWLKGRFESTYGDHELGLSYVVAVCAFVCLLVYPSVCAC